MSRDDARGLRPSSFLALAEGRGWSPAWVCFDEGGGPRVRNGALPHPLGRG